MSQGAYLPVAPDRMPHVWSAERVVPHTCDGPLLSKTHARRS